MVEELVANRFGVREGKVQLRSHRIEEDSPFEERQHHRPALDSVTGLRVAVVTYRIGAENHLSQRAVTNDLSGLSVRFQHTAKPGTEILAQAEEVLVGPRLPEDGEGRETRSR